MEEVAMISSTADHQPTVCILANDTACSILVVDDDTMVREATAWMLEGAGFLVHEAADGVAALEHLVKSGPPDLVITDINMPRMDGLTLTEHVRQRWPSMPVLIVTGRPQPPGTRPYMLKPFGWDELIGAVSRLLHIDEPDFRRPD